MLRQRARWTGIARAWRSKALDRDDINHHKADVLEFCRNDVDFMIKQLGRRMSREELDEAFEAALTNADERLIRDLPNEDFIFSQDRPNG